MSNPTNQRDEDLKKAKEISQNLDITAFSHSYLVKRITEALTAQRQSWEREKAETEEIRQLLVTDPALDRDNKDKDSLRQLVVVALNGLFHRGAEITKLEAEKKGLEERVRKLESAFRSANYAHKNFEDECARLKLELEASRRERDEARMSESKVRSEADRIIDELNDDIKNLKSRNEELEKKLDYFQSQFNHYYPLAEKVTSENDCLKAENAELRGGSHG